MVFGKGDLVLGIYRYFYLSPTRDDLKDSSSFITNSSINIYLKLGM